MTRATVTTVTGDIRGDQLGPTLAHEHLYCDISVQSGRADNTLMDVPLLAGELRESLAPSGRSVLEMTPEGIGRDPVKLREISAASGVHVVSGIAFYDESTYPAWVRTATPDAIADFIVRELDEGTDGVCAGFIGELASHNEPGATPGDYRLHDLEQGVFVAAAQAQRRTGAGISTHASLGRGGHAQLDALERAGADLTHVVIGHCDAEWNENIDDDLDYYLPILQRGAYCQFDLIGWTELSTDEIRAQRVAALVELGYARQMTLSTDTCRLSQLQRHGGRGFDYLWTSFLPRLRQAGVSELDIQSMLVDAPRTFVTGG